MNLRSTGLVTAAVLGALALPAFAQEKVVDADAARPAGNEAGLYRASELIGMEVKGNDNEDLGKVKDLFVDRQTNQIEYLILDTSSFVDLQGQMPVVPWSIVQWQPGANPNAFMLFAPLTQARIRTAPLITLSNGPLTGIPQLRSQVNQFYRADVQQRRAARPDLNQPQNTTDSNQRNASPNRTGASQNQNRNATKNPANRPQPGSDSTRNPPSSTDKPSSTTPKSDSRPNSSKSPPKPDASTTPDKPRSNSSTDKPQDPAPKKPANP